MLGPRVGFNTARVSLLQWMRVKMRESWTFLTPGDDAADMLYSANIVPHSPRFQDRKIWSGIHQDPGWYWGKNPWPQNVKDKYSPFSWTWAPSAVA